MINRHASHPASDLPNGRGVPAHFPVKAAAPPTPYRLGGVLRWGAGEAGGLQLVRRAVALTMAVLLTLLPLMQTAAAAETTRVAALGQVRLPLEVSPPAFTMAPPVDFASM